MLHSICQQIWKIQQWPLDWERSVLTPIPKKSKAKECSNYCKIALISYASKVMLKILQVTLQQYMNWELPHVQAGFRKGTGTRDQIANIRWIIKKASSLQFSCLVMSDSLWPHGLQHARPPRPSPTPRVYSNSMSLLMPIESLMPSNPLILCLPLLILPSIFPNIRTFSNESVLHIRWPKYWSFSFNVSPFNEHSGLISFRIDWLDLLAVQETLKSLL